MTEPSFFSTELHAGTWRYIMSSIEEAATINNVIEGRGRAEGYALGLFESGRIADAQRNELVVGAFQSAVQRCKFLHGQ